MRRMNGGPTAMKEIRKVGYSGLIFGLTDDVSTADLTCPHLKGPMPCLRNCLLTDYDEAVV